MTKAFFNLLKYFCLLCGALSSVLLSASQENSKSQPITISEADLSVLQYNWTVLPKPTFKPAFQFVTAYTGFTGHSYPTQKLIDKIISKLTLESRYGQHILKQLLNCETRNIFNHLGVARSTADKLSQTCKTWTLASHPHVSGKPSTQIKKVSPGRHQFIFVLTPESFSWPYDSWTNPHSNKTFIIIRTKNNKIQVNEYDLMQYFAHELAIYFDGKSTDILLHPHFPPQSLVRPQPQYFVNSYTHDVSATLNNPIITLSLAFIRAFKVEKQMVKDIYENDQRFKTRFSKSYALHFLNSKCKKQCLLKVIHQQAIERRQEILPALALLPLYGVTKKHALFLNQSSKKMRNLATRFLIDIPQYFRNTYWDSQNSIQDGFIAMVTPEAFPGQSYSYNSVSKAFFKNFWTSDLAVLERTKIELTNGQKIPLIEFMATPEISNINIKFATGPRPRVIGGGVRR